MIEDRIRDIESYFRVHLRRVSKVQFLSKAEWDALMDPASDPSNLHIPYGVSVPELHQGLFTTLICPELIALQTITMFDADLRTLLAAWEMHLNLHIAATFQVIDPDELEASIDCWTFKEAPEMTMLLTQTQLNQLDG